MGTERAAELDRLGVWAVQGGLTRHGCHRYRCREIGSYAQAQELLRQVHTYLDGNGDGVACTSLRR
jgi:hypothetical protein